jgi:multidrug efflux system membrane fusion protein
MSQAMSQKRWIVVLTLLFGGALTAWLLTRRPRDPRSSQREDSKPARIVPVSATRVERRDVPLYLDGLGSIIAYKTVTVRTQVDGRLNRVLFKEGQRVHVGGLLAEVDPRPFLVQLHQAEGAMLRDKATFESGKLNLERFATLREGNLVAQQQVDDQRALVRQAEGAMHVDEAQIESAKLNLDYARVRSPIEGVTGVRLVDPGNIVHPGDPNGIVVLTQLDPIALLFTLPQDVLPAVQEAFAAGPLSVEAYSRDGAQRLGVGRLELIDNQMNQATATMRLKAIFPNPKYSLWPNQFVKARLLVSTHKGALVVPATVVEKGPKGLFAYVIKKDQTVEARPVEVEMTTGEITLIRKGLTAGEQVVVDGQNQLRPGIRVQPREVGAALPSPPAENTR